MPTLIPKNENTTASRTSKAVVCDALVSLLLEAQEAIENLPIGGIGPDGATQEEIAEAEEAGRTIEDDASHHQGQKAWLILERAKALLANIPQSATPGGQSPAQPYNHSPGVAL